MDEYIMLLIKYKNTSNYKSHAPIDSLAQHSMIFTNAYANGRQSIHGMSLRTIGIPSFKDAFTFALSKAKIESLVSNF
jgi:hypothetical protein